MVNKWCFVNGPKWIIYYTNRIFYGFVDYIVLMATTKKTFADCD